jgi:lysophospholipase L1-like esterase
MRWNHLHPRLEGLLSNALAPPAILLIHLGGNDLGSTRLGSLIHLINHDVMWIHSHHPRITVILSSILPRLSYRGARCNEAVDRSRLAVNRFMRRLMERTGGLFVSHPSLSGAACGNLLLPDGVHLNPEGNSLFLSDLYHALAALPN